MVLLCWDGLLAPGLLSELVVKSLAPLAPGYVEVGLVALLVI